MSKMMMQDMLCTTDRVVTLPTPAAPPSTWMPLTTPIMTIRTAKTTALIMPWAMSDGVNTPMTSNTKAASVMSSVVET